MFASKDRLVPLIVTLAILLPGLIAGTWVAFYLIQHTHASAPAYMHYQQAAVLVRVL